MAGKTLEQGERIFRRMIKAIEAPAALAHDYAVATLKVARATAAGKPTPQARMAAANMKVDGDTIHPLAGGAPERVALGSEFGSDIYLQFHRPSNRTGYWLYPAVESAAALKAGDQVLDALIQQVVDG